MLKKFWRGKGDRDNWDRFFCAYTLENWQKSSLK